MIRLGALVLIGLLISGVAAPVSVADGARGGTDSLRVAALGPDSVTARPGTSLTLRVRLANDADRARTVALTPILPERWRLLAPVDSVRLGPGQQRLRLVGVSVPAGLAAGPRRVALRGRGAEGGTDTAAVTVQVPVVRRARLRVQEAPRRSAGDRTYRATVEIVNRGNQAVRFVLSGSATPSAPVSFRPRADSLRPGARRRVEARVEPGPLTDAVEQQLAVRARLTPWDTTLTARTAVALVPRGAADAGLLAGPPYPGTLRLAGFGGGGTPTGQAAFQGSSTLGSNGARSLDVLLRTPNQATRRFGQRSTYRAAYTTPSWTVRAGDHTFGRTPLAETGTFGLGGEVQYRGDGWRVGGYGLQTRFGASVRQGAAYAGGRPHPRTEVLANVVHNDGGRAQGTLGTLQATATPWARARLEVEGGYGRGRSGSGIAYRAALEGEGPRLRYRAGRTRIDAGFPGTFNNVRRTFGGVSVRPAEALSLRGRVRRSVRERATTRAFSSTVAAVGAALQGRVGGMDGSLQARGSLDRRPLLDEEQLTLRGGLRTDRVSLRPRLEVGRRRSAEVGGEQHFRTLGLGTALRLGRQRLQAEVDWTQAPAQPSVLRATSSVQLQVGARTTLQARGTLQDRGGPTPLRFSAQGRVQHRFAFGHTASALVRSRSEGAGTEAKLTYALPVSLPTPAFSTGSTLDGRVVDAQTNAPLSGVRVRLGPARRLTNDEGAFSLPVPEEGSARLDVSGLGQGRVPLLDLPRPVGAEDTASELVLPITDAASLTVTVIRYGFASARAALQGDPPRPQGPLAREVVRFRRDGRSARRLTGPEGRATIDNLRPGRWTMSLAGVQVASDKAPMPDSLTVALRPGQDTTLTFEVRPTERPDIQFEDGETLQLNGDNEPTDNEPTDNEPVDDGPEDGGAIARDTADAGTASPGGPVSFAVRTGPYVAQVGAFARLEGALRRAEQARARTDSVGLVPDVVDGDTLYRVQVGPYPSAATASAALRGRSALPTTVRPAADGVYFTVQAGAFEDWTGARRRAAALHDEERAVSIQPYPWAGQMLYRVWVGRFAGATGADQARAAIAEQVPGAFVVRTARQAPYAVQVGAFATPEQARRRVAQARDAGISAYVRFRPDGTPPRYKVLVGAYAAPEPAQRRRETLNDVFPGAFVYSVFEK
ncbi:cell division protein FtsN [Salinibacter ruber]|uniref:SPOR domain-containing protein n=1 Tax=Salinibacter ruber TaxID=146919 RepID=UPI002168D960|nr:SPOR domain-containing protein [Salinibacter ruber]MCS3863225.1 cell division protein FtsN [Salinibacter ruber]MCS4184037.1 cell division protein FtsN [Salinibacter ruber]